MTRKIQTIRDEFKMAEFTLNHAAVRGDIKLDGLRKIRDSLESELKNHPRYKSKFNLKT